MPAFTFFSLSGMTILQPCWQWGEMPAETWSRLSLRLWIRVQANPIRTMCQFLKKLQFLLSLCQNFWSNWQFCLGVIAGLGSTGVKYLRANLVVLFRVQFNPRWYLLGIFLSKDLDVGRSSLRNLITKVIECSFYWPEGSSLTHLFQLFLLSASTLFLWSMFAMPYKDSALVLESPIPCLQHLSSLLELSLYGTALGVY